MNNTTTKDRLRNTWVAQTDFPLTDNTFLRVSTSKNYDGVIRSKARAYEIKDEFCVFTGNNYNKTLIEATARATRPEVEKQHAEAIKFITPAILKEAQA